MAHFPLRCLTYLLVSLFQRRYCRPSRTSLEKVVQRLQDAELKMPPHRSLQPMKKVSAALEIAA